MKLTVISYPKAGRTWLITMLERLLPATASIVRTHDQAADDVCYSDFNPDKSKYANDNVLMLLRDPGDVQVSYYYHRQYRNSQCVKNGVVQPRFDFDLAGSLRHNYYGFKRIPHFYAQWHAAQSLPHRFCLITYEELHADCTKTLQRILSAFNIPTTAQDITAAIAYAGFGRMRARERKQNPKLTPEQFKTRRGKVGAYLDKFTKQDLRYMADCYAAYPVCSWLTPYHKKLMENM